MVSLKSMNFKYCPLSQGAKLLILIIFAITFTICAFNIEGIFNMFFEVFEMFSIYVVYFSTGSPVLTMLTLIIPFFLLFGVVPAIILSTFLGMLKLTGTLDFYDSYIILSYGRKHIRLDIDKTKFYYTLSNKNRNFFCKIITPYKDIYFDAYKKELKSMYEDYTSYSLYQAMSAAKEFLCPNEANSADDDASNSTSEYTPDHKSAELPNIEDTYNPASDCILEPQSTELPDIEGTYTPAKDY